MKKRILSLILMLSMMVSMLPATAFAAEEETSGPVDVPESEAKITVSAASGKTVTVKKKEAEPIEPVEKSLTIVAEEYDIARDYEQPCEITVYNWTDQAKKFYLNAENIDPEEAAENPETTNARYPDLSYQFISTGSKDEPAYIAPGESLEVTLSIFAQNAESDTYYIPVTAYVLTDADGEYVEDSKQSITVNCVLPTLNLSWAEVSSSPTTLSKTYTITNNGDDTLTDLTISASDELKDYISFSPIISNYELEPGGNVGFTVYPDLAKMKNENISQLSGQLIASCAGQADNHDCSFDTGGKEITVTTMGKLALKQDGNPFSNFEIVEDTVSIQYYDGTAYTELPENATIDAILDEKKQINIQYKSDIDLGLEAPTPVEISMQSTVVDGNAKEPEPEITEQDDGTVILTLYTSMSAEEYLTMINESMPDTPSSNDPIASIPTSRSIVAQKDEDPFEKGEKALLKTTFTVNNMLKPFGGKSDSIAALSSVYTVCTMVEDFEGALDVANNPKIDTNYKLNYLGGSLMKTILTGGRAAVSMVNPLVGTVFTVLTKPLDILLDKYQEAVLEEALAEYYASIEGHQCTNRGKISVKFRAPDYTNGSKKPSMHTSGRMHGGGYVNKEDTNYDIYLNDKPAGETNNSGLTDVFMQEVPTDNLEPGKENTITFDYDTHPGSHSVTTETEITLLYPDDTEIAYIDTPDDLQDVRTKPDFAIYSENIFVEGDPIINEQTKLKFNVYNKGSRGGWFNISCTDDSGKTLKSESNEYLKAFSFKTFEIDWTPSKENNTITVTSTNTSINLPERRDDNNSATATFTARTRQTPQLGAVSGNTIYENQPFSISLSASQCEDFVSAKFTCQGKEIPAEVTGSGESRRFLLTFDEGLPAGAYTVNVEFTYNDSATTQAKANSTADFTVLQETWNVPEAYVSSSSLLYGEKLEFSVYNAKNLVRTEVSVNSGTAQVIEPLDDSSDYEKYYLMDMSAYTAGEQNISIKMYYKDRNGNEAVKEAASKVTLYSEAESYCAFSLPASVTNVATSNLAVYNSYGKEDVTVEETANGYRFLKSLDMIGNSADYTLVIPHSSGVIVTKLSDITGEIPATGNAVTVKKTDKDELTTAYITKIPNVRHYVRIPVSLADPLTLSPGEYSLNIAGTVDGVEFNEDISVDVTNQNDEIDLSSFALVYYLDTSKAGDSSYSVRLCTRNSKNDTWNYSTLSQSSDSGSNILKYYTTNENLIQKAKEYAQVYLLARSSSEVYFLRLKDSPDASAPALAAIDANTETIQLDKSSLHKVSLVCNNEKMSITRVFLNWDGLSANLRGDTIFVPAGEYDISVSLSDGDESINKNVTDTVTEDCEVAIDGGISGTYSDVVITWPAPFDATADVSCHNNDVGWNTHMSDITSGSTIDALNGNCFFDVNLTYEEIPFEFSGQLAVAESNTGITIGNEFTADFNPQFDDEMEYEAEGIIQFGIDNIMDKNGNQLYNYRNIPWNADVTFTNTSDSNRTFTRNIPVDSLDNISVSLPIEAGTYSIHVVLTPNVQKVKFTVSVTDSYASTSGEGQYEVGDTVTVNAGNRSNYSFSGWTSADVSFANPSSATTTFVMPEKDVAVTANWTYDGRGDDGDDDGDDNDDNSSNSSTPSRPSNSGGSGGGGSTTITKPTPSKVVDTNVSVAATTQDGAATSAINKATADKMVADAVKNKSENVNVKVNAPVDAASVTATIPSSSAKDLADKTGSTLNIETPLATVVIPNDAVGELAGKGKDTIGVMVEKSDDDIKITIQADGQDAGTLSGVKASIPTDKTGSGNVAVIVNPDGTETVVKKSMVKDGKIVVPINGSTTVRVADRSKNFDDISGHWATDSIGFVTSRELFNGVSEKNFAPNAQMTRAMLVTVLHRLEDNPESIANKFEDVPDGTWYTEAVAWAASNGIVNGKSETNFAPNDSITREQLAAILYRYADMLEIDIEITGDLKRFTDAGSVSSYAANAITWAVSKGIINGKTNTTIDPQGNASRAEVATMLMRMVGLINRNE